MNQKGGVGKTTTTFHFAAYQAKKGKRVLCIDLDPQGSLSFFMKADTQDKNTVYELMMGEATFAETVQRSEYGDIIPADNTLGVLSGNIEARQDKFLALKNALNGAMEAYDYVLIDCPPGITLYNLNALSVSTDVVLITQAEALSLLGLPQMFNLIQNGNAFYANDVHVAGVLITMYNGALRIAREMFDEIQDVVGAGQGLHIYKTAIKKLTAINVAAAQRTSVFDVAPKSQAAQLYGAACEEIEASLK